MKLKPPFKKTPELRNEYMLARELKMTHARLLATMSHSEFVYWMALYRVEQAESEARKKKPGKRAIGKGPSAREDI